MDYFAKFLRPAAPAPVKPERDYLGEFHEAWEAVEACIFVPTGYSIV